MPLCKTNHITCYNLNYIILVTKWVSPIEYNHVLTLLLFKV